jgi:hypothetical protein
MGRQDVNSAKEMHGQNTSVAQGRGALQPTWRGNICGHSHMDIPFPLVDFLGAHGALAANPVLK